MQKGGLLHWSIISCLLLHTKDLCLFLTKKWPSLNNYNDRDNDTDKQQFTKCQSTTEVHFASSKC